MANILISPNKYVQGSGELENLARHAKTLGSRFFIMGSPSGLKRIEDTVRKSFSGTDAECFFEPFSRECSMNEVNRLREKYHANNCDAVIGIGGGKTLDTAKAVAYYEKAPVAIVPTIASTDAPCSALTVLYTDDGIFDRYLFLPANPDIVLVDTQIVSQAPVRLFVAGMGDALATYFEARAASEANANNCAGGKCTLAALALAELCYDTLIDQGLKAKLAMEHNVCTKAVENIIEANTLLSGIGFESAGLAGAHAIHNGLTVLEASHDYYHGEKVAFGTLVQLMLENAPMEEIEEVLQFCIDVGLPVSLAQLGLADATPDDIRKVAQAATAEGESIYNMPFPVDTEMVYAAIYAADSIGRYYLDLE